MSGKSVTKNTSYLTIAYIAQKVLSFFYFVLVARFIGVESLGKYTFALSFTTLFAVFVVGLGSGLYLTANLGPGPRVGLMTGLQNLTNKPIAFIRTALEVSTVIVGFYLGGIVGIGTLLFAFGIGPAVSLGIYIVMKYCK